MINSIRRSTTAAALLVLLLIVCEASQAAESPTSAGPVSKLDTPIFRIPKTANAPEIDGVMAEGEWEDASALSAFWYDYIAGHFYFLAVSPVYPEASWLKARGRFPNVVHHPLYGILWDDHIELEMRPYHDAARGFQLGLFKWVVNPIDVIADYHWSTTRGSEFTWNSRARFRSSVTPTKWILEAEVPLAEMAFGLYDGVDEDGNRIVQSPPPDGTAYRTWFARAIGGNGPFFNAFDAHQWNTTKTMMVFDSRAVAFQINELGPIMDDIVDVHITVKNHNNRSETMRLGFFVENADGMIYSSYEDDSLSDGMLELIPGEVRKLRLRKPFPGITERGNTLWFDVRTAGYPAKPIFLTRLIDFHSQDKQNWRGGKLSFKEARIDVIEKLRPPRIDFDVRFDIWPYTNRIAAVIDRGIHGASEESKTATEARVAAIDLNTGKEIANHIEPFYGNFAIAEFDLPELHADREYQLSVLLFDENRRIVGEHTSENFNKWGFPWWMLEIRGEPAPGQVLTPVEEWFGNEIGLDDVVWEPFTPLELIDTGFEGLKHRFDVDATALPAQLYIKPHYRVLPLEYRTEDAQPAAEELVAVGRGPQLRGPFRLEAVIDGVRHTSQAIEPAQLVRQWKSELEYHAKVRVGPIDVEMNVQYDCDGSIHAKLVYGTEAPQVVESFELLADIRGPVDKVASGIAGGGGMTGADVWECALPPYEGVVWDSTTVEMPLYYSQFVPWVFFGSGDRGFSWYADNDRGWGLDKYSSSMNLERNAGGQVTWRILFVNHPFDVQGSRTIDFHILTHPAKPKPDNYRTIAWNYHGSWMTTGYGIEAVDLSDEYLKGQWHRAASAPRDIPHEQAATWRNDDGPWNRHCRWRQTGHTDAHKISVYTDRVFEERGAYLLARQIRVGRRSGYWWDESWPVPVQTTSPPAMHTAAIQLPWKKTSCPGSLALQPLTSAIFTSGSPASLQPATCRSGNTIGRTPAPTSTNRSHGTRCSLKNAAPNTAATKPTSPRNSRCRSTDSCAIRSPDSSHVWWRAFP